MPAETVDEYIAGAPPAARAQLRALRRAIREAAPEAEESISYRIPYYAWKGRLVWFGAFSGHIGLFVRPPVLEEHRSELRGYTMKSSLHFPLDKQVPTGLVKKLVRAAVRKNEERGPA
ncbi:MAG: DUF1801 domain-containing protein [Nitrososphaerota archaeon]|nr:DUF1801 domain-containing protein [Nitrososphaerota archaeon]